MTPNPRHPDAPEPRPPARLADALRDLGRPGFPVPPAADAAIRATARLHFRSRQHRWLRIVLPASAAAAAILLVLTLAQPAWQPPSGSDRAPSYARDAAPDPRLAPAAPAARRITILDAFALARELKAGQSVELTRDFNGDRRVDQADVEALALAAVRLEVGT